jgi:hypothetical protein
MDLPTVSSSTISPTGNGLLIQLKDLYNRLHRTAISKRYDADYDQFSRLAKMFQYSSSPWTKRLFANLAKLALPFTIMDTNIALPNLLLAQHARFGQNWSDSSISIVFVSIDTSCRGPSLS